MAKVITSSTEFDNSAQMFTLSRPQVNQKILFVDAETFNGIFTVYNDEDDKKVYANGIKCLICDNLGLRAHVLPVNDFTAQSTELVDKTFTPQLQHEISREIAVYGKTALDTLASAKTVANVAQTYDIKVKSFRNNKIYSWTTLGLDATDEHYTIADNKIKFDGKEIEVSKCIEFFKQHQKNQTARLPQ